jgi:hypothetical protein
MTDTLQIIVESDDKRAVMYLQGRVGIKSSPELRDRLFAILRTGLGAAPISTE